VPRNLYRPESFHGFGRRGPYFEGWYFKFVDRTGSVRLAVIPGVFISADGMDSHAFIQTLEGSTGRTAYHRFSANEFRIHPTEFLLEIGRNRFCLDEVALDIGGPEGIHGVLRMDGVQGWPVRPLSPGIMGWYGLVPFMEAYHGVLSFDHAIRGSVVVNGAQVDFQGGRGYIEKDWGQAFPRAWIWMQSNHFATPGVCLTASVAHIPWLGRAFRGFIVGLWLQSELLTFATYSGAQIERLVVNHNRVEWIMRGRADYGGRRQTLCLAIRAEREGDDEDLLHAPYRTAMLQRVMESLTATVHVRLSDESGRILFDESGRYAGLELGGNLPELLNL
jgi:hypothetical protein